MATSSVQKSRLENAADASIETDRQTYLRNFAEGLVAEISAVSPEHCEELLSGLIAELAMAAADQRRKNERRKRQMECIAAAKDRGVQFGRKRKPLPEDFDRCRRDWQEGRLSLQKAAEGCGMSPDTFHRAVIRQEQQQDGWRC